MLHFCFIRDKKTVISEFLSSLHLFQGEGGSGFRCLLFFILKNKSKKIRSFGNSPKTEKRNLQLFFREAQNESKRTHRTRIIIKGPVMNYRGGSILFLIHN